MKDGIPDFRDGSGGNAVRAVRRAARTDGIQQAVSRLKRVL